MGQHFPLKTTKCHGSDWWVFNGLTDSNSDKFIPILTQFYSETLKKNFGGWRKSLNHTTNIFEIYCLLMLLLNVQYFTFQGCKIRIELLLFGCFSVTM